MSVRVDDTATTHDDLRGIPLILAARQQVDDAFNSEPEMATSGLGEPLASDPARIVIAVLVPFQTLTGPGRQLAAAAASLRASGVILHPVVFVRPGAAAPYVTFLEDHGVRCTTVEDRGALDVALVGRVASVLRELRPCILQTHGYKASAVAVVLSRTRHLPWVGFFHGWTTESSRARFYHRLERLLLKRADRIVVVARGQLALFAGAADRVRLIDNAVLGPSVPSQPAREAGASFAAPGRPLLAVVGRLSSEKGVDLFLHALSELNRDGESVYAVIAGDGPERDRLHALSASLGLADRVRFLGHVEDVGPLYQHTDALVIPSRSEGLPNVLLEALAADVPVVGTAVGAVPDVLGESPGSAVVRPESAAALVDGIRTVLLTGRSAPATAARRDIIARYSLDRRVGEHVELYRELVESSMNSGDAG